MSRLRSILMACGSVLLAQACRAQGDSTKQTASRQAFSLQRYNHSTTISYILGGYAVANLAGSAIGVGQTSGERHYFHQMNLYWNAVNLGIAGLGLLGLRKQNPSTETINEAIKKNDNLKKVLLINAGLDVAYVAGGLYLNNRGNVNAEQADELHGYGKAVVVQGMFLLVFDAVNYLIAKKRGDTGRLQLVGAGPMGVGMAGRF